MDGEVERIQCFFNPSHMIFRSRYPYHYEKCKQRYPNVKHKVCPYNATHIMAPEALDTHVIRCQSRPLPILTASNAAAHQPTAKEPADSWEESAEAWGTEKPMVPQNVQQNTYIYAPLIGASRSERVQHRLAGRLQFHQIEDSKQSSVTQSNNDKKKKKKKKKKSHNPKPNSEILDAASENKTIPTNVGNAPLAERQSVASESLSLAGLSLKD